MASSSQSDEPFPAHFPAKQQMPLLQRPRCQENIEQNDNSTSSPSSTFSLSSTQPETHRDLMFDKDHASSIPPKSPKKYRTTLSSNDHTCDSKYFYLHRFLAILNDDSGGYASVTLGLTLITILGIILGLNSSKNMNLNGAGYQSFSAVLGYTYCTAWSISFYPQVFLNYRRKSTEGLSVDFCYLNVFGFWCYSAFNVSLYWSKPIQEQYARRHNGMMSLVEPNDVAFGLHSIVLSTIWLLQVGYYNGFLERPPLKGTIMFLVAMVCVSLVYAFLISIMGETSANSNGKLNWLDFLYTLANFKVVITIYKYIVQTLSNCQHQSTQGWSIWNSLLDIMGGVLSLFQLVLDSWNTNDWSGLTGNPAKLALGVVSIVFDIILLVQHYILFPRHRGLGHKVSGSSVVKDSSSVEMAGVSLHRTHEVS